MEVEREVEYYNLDVVISVVTGLIPKKSQDSDDEQHLY